ncbi:hypothetical protein I4U23_003468 [Adineta vaga]|nr:hypothetical protein I4U23_003468 [Adineta vaga]
MFVFHIIGILILIGSIVSSGKDSDPILIENTFVTCYSDRLVIHFYYFPFGSKTIKYENIRSCELLQHDQLNMFQTKCWGMAFSPIWWHLDIQRQWRKYYLVLDGTQWPKIGITMDDDDTIKVYNLLMKHFLHNK